MLPPSWRLRKTKDFQTVFTQGTGLREGGLFLKVRDVKSGQTRIGIVVSKQVSRSAAKRNRIKRVLREGVRFQLPRIQDHADAVIVVLPEFKEMKAEETRNLLQGLFLRAGMLRT